MTADITTFAGGYHHINSISKAYVLSFMLLYKERGPAYPTISTLRFWKTLQKDHETTSPRIYVNRRTPSCLLILNFPDSSAQDRSASLQFPLRVLRVHVCKSSKKSRTSIQHFLVAKVRRNSELFSIYGKNVLFCSYIYTSMPFSINIWHSRVILI